MSTARTNADEWGAPRERIALERGENDKWIWERHAPHAMAKWATPPIERQALRQMQREVTLVWRKRESNGGHAQSPWVIVAESAALYLSKIQGRGMGLYVWRDFDRGVFRN